MSPRDEDKLKKTKTDTKDAVYKQNMKENRETERRKTLLILADYVLVCQHEQNKWRTPFQPIIYTVSDIRGSQITARTITDGRTVAEMPATSDF